MKPLTEDQIAELSGAAMKEAWTSLTGSVPNIFPIIFARAIESYHGIEDRQAPEA